MKPETSFDKRGPVEMLCVDFLSSLDGFFFLDQRGNNPNEEKKTARD